MWIFFCALPIPEKYPGDAGLKAGKIHNRNKPRRFPTARTRTGPRRVSSDLLSLPSYSFVASDKILSQEKQYDASLSQVHATSINMRGLNEQIQSFGGDKNA
ncbi:hypothetical protein [Sphingobium sp.]|uniref:hypothetical protein n=1 Tax=Sphingobium sp. TaxID=1912891 RepID=UPI0028BE549A|nr:hypothetical protein [Sphingobium sp.]